MYPLPALSVELPPAQNEVIPVMAGVGLALTARLNVAVPVHPLASVTVTE